MSHTNWRRSYDFTVSSGGVTFQITESLDRNRLIEGVALLLRDYESIESAEFDARVLRVDACPGIRAGLERRAVDGA